MRQASIAVVAAPSTTTRLLHVHGVFRFRVGGLRAGPGFPPNRTPVGHSVRRTDGLVNSPQFRAGTSRSGIGGAKPEKDRIEFASNVTQFLTSCPKVTPMAKTNAAVSEPMRRSTRSLSIRNPGRPFIYASAGLLHGNRRR